MLAIFNDVLTGPEFRQDKLDLAKSQMRSGISRRNDDAHGIVRARVHRHRYTARTRPMAGHEEYATIDRINRGDLADLLPALFLPGQRDAGSLGRFQHGRR